LGRICGVPASFASHQLCSAVFVGGLDPDTYFREAVLPKLGPAAKLIRYDIDRDRGEVRVSLAGVLHSRAVHEGAFGCRVIHPGMGFEVAGGETPAAAPARMAIAGPDPVVTPDAALSQAIDRAFMEPASPPHRYTQAVVIVHHGHVVAERYAAGVNPATP